MFNTPLLFDKDHKLPILVWPWKDAPESLRALSQHGGDEDWVVHVPPHFAKNVTEYGTPHWIAAMGCCDVSRHEIADGSIVFIGAHA